MRLTTKMMTLAAALVLATATAAPPAPATTTNSVVASVTAVAFTPVTYGTLNVRTQDAKVEVDVDDDGGAWYTNPVWIAIGIVALVLIVLLITAAGRRDSTTVVK